MSTSGIVGEEIDKQSALARAAFEGISGIGAGANAGETLARAVLDTLGPYSSALYIAERIVESDVFDVDLVQAVHSNLLTLERIADDMLAAARQRGYFDDAEIAEPLRWLETCNEQVKDCMVALEAMLDPRLGDLMASATDEHRRGETIPLASIR